jgi:preprotein translocase subunit SecF
LQLISKAPHFAFMAYRRVAAGISGVLIAVSVISVIALGLNFGMDFTGGLLLEVGHRSPADLTEVRGALEAAGYPNAQVQSFGSANDVLIRLPAQAAAQDPDAVEEQLLTALVARDASAELRRVEFVGPQVGRDLAEQGSLAMFFALMMIFIYVMLRFRWKLAVGAIVALVHVVIVTIGFFSVFRLPFDLPVLGSVLAVIGYSLNDTIVVFDRVRENFRLVRREAADVMIDTSINQTLSRTIITGLTTLLVLVALLFLGGETLRGFSIALIVGIVIGTYSSIYVASAIALVLKVVPSDLVPPKREPADEEP